MPGHRLSPPAQALRVIGYIRVSTAREEMISPELQLQSIKDYCTRKGYILDEVIEDLDATGRNFARAGIQKAIERVEKAGIAVVVVWKFSRFGRNRPGVAVNLARVEAVGGRLESATEDVDTTTSTGKLGRGMLFEFAAYESDRAGEQWEEAHDYRIANGLTVNGGPRWGYIYHRTTVNTRMGLRQCPQGCALGTCTTGYTINPAMARYAYDVYDRYIRGEGYRTIALWLNEHGIRNAAGGLWDNRAIRIYMYSGMAAGLLRNHPKTCKCKAKQLCPRSIYLPGAHDPIISTDMWHQYQQTLKVRTKLPPRVNNPVYPLAGFVRCGHCFGAMTAKSEKLRGQSERTPGYLYRCANYARGKGCPGTSVLRTELEDRVLAWLKKFANEVDREAEHEPAAVVAAGPSTEERRKVVLREQQAIAKAKTTLTVQLGRGVVDEASYRDACADLDATNGQLENALAALAAEAERVREPTAPVARELALLWPALQPAHRREMLAQFVSAIFVWRVQKRGAVQVKVLTKWGEIAVI